MTTVLLVDDHKLVRAGLVALLGTADDLDVVGEAADGEQALELARELRPDVVLMDLSMPVMDGVTAIQHLLAEDPEARVVVLTSNFDADKVNEALTAGAIGYLLKDCDPRELIGGVRAAAEGHAPLDPRVTRALLPGAGPATSAVEVLSTREAEVLTLVAQGLQNHQIARRLGISDNTVKVHITKAYRSIGAADRAAAVRWARENLRTPMPQR